MKLEQRFTNLKTGETLTQKEIDYLLSENPIALFEDYKHNIICECGAELHRLEKQGRNRSTIHFTDRDWQCRECGNEYTEYHVEYPSEQTSYDYAVDGIYTKITGEKKGSM